MSTRTPLCETDKPVSSIHTQALNLPVEPGIALTDYVVSRFRDELDLWYDINDGGIPPQSVNAARLTDGASTLWLSFSTLFDPDSVTTIGEGGSAVYLYGSFLDDSRVKLLREDLRYFAVQAIEAFEALPKHVPAARQVALLSLEITHEMARNQTDEWLETIADVLRARIQEFPAYSGKYNDLSCENDPIRHWAQLVLSTPADEGKIAHGLRSYLTNASEFQTGTNKRYYANSC